MIQGEKAAIEYLKTNPNLKKVISFEEHMNFMIKSEDRKKIKKIVGRHQDLFYNESHFVRVAVLKLIREYKK